MVTNNWWFTSWSPEDAPSASKCLALYRRGGVSVTVEVWLDIPPVLNVPPTDRTRTSLLPIWYHHIHNVTYTFKRERMPCADKRTPRQMYPALARQPHLHTSTFNHIPTGKLIKQMPEKKCGPDHCRQLQISKSNTHSSIFNMCLIPTTDMRSEILRFSNSNERTLRNWSWNRKLDNNPQFKKLAPTNQLVNGHK